MMNDGLTKGDAMEKGAEEARILRDHYWMHRNGKQAFQVMKPLQDGRWAVRMYGWRGIEKQFLTEEEIRRDYRPCTGAEAIDVL